jgi:acyl-CoA dehydrogenase
MRLPAGSDDDLYWGGCTAVFASEDQRLWFERMVAKGWTAPTWPTEYGGGGLTLDQAEILREEMTALGCRLPLAGWGLTLLGPTLLRYGSEAMKQSFLPATARGEIRWCQGFSEPGAGSDLASLSTRAEPVEGGFLVNGQKIWTTYGDRSDWMFCLVRTDRSAPKREGISFLLIDMASKGVTARPITLISGSREFCEVFFEDVFVPADQIVGEINRGWDVTKFLLGCEREVSGRVKAQGAKPLGAALVSQGLEISPFRRQEIARFDIEAWGFTALLSESAQLAALGVERPGLGSAVKYIGSELNKSRLELQMDLHGSQALLWEGDAPDDGLLARTWLRTKANSLAGGSNEMQLNMIARHVLGLPDRPANRTGDALAMDFTEDLRLLRDAVRLLLDRFADKATVRARRAQDSRYSTELWQSFCDAGYSNILSLDDGRGAALGARAGAIVQEELGRAMIRLPFLATSLIGTSGLLAIEETGLQERLIAGVADGSIRMTLAIDEGSKHDPGNFSTRLEPRGDEFELNGTKRFVPDASSCDAFVVAGQLPSGDLALIHVPTAAKGVSICITGLIDEGDWGDVTFNEVMIGRHDIISQGDDAHKVLRAMLGAGKLGAAAELLGIGDEACDSTVAYLKTRRQFDHYLAEYQALQHRIALVHIRLELARAAVRAAARTIDEALESSGSTSAAKFLAGEAATLAVREAVQLHGGIAMTDEYDIGFFLKRAKVLCELYGDATHQADCFAATLGY